MPRTKKVSKDWLELCLDQYEQGRSLKHIGKKGEVEKEDVIRAVFDEQRSGKWKGNETSFVRIRGVWHDYEQLRLLF